MPANRSRTDRWRNCLWQIYERGGAIEISLARPDASPDPASDLIWRVKILNLGDHEIITNQPAAFGRTIPIAPGTKLVGAMSVGQNRWMFQTEALGVQPGDRLHLAMPETVERCPRRSYYRVTTAAVELPDVECWPLLDPASVVAAEVANEAYARDMLRHRRDPTLAQPQAEQVLPEVGPGFGAKLVNISGGGLGLIVSPQEASGLDRARFVWMRVNLGKDLPAPLALTGKVVHTHIDSAQSVHVGLAFEFGFNPSHREFVISQVCGVVAKLRNDQGSAQAA
ncbi:MAG: PilZ domain-containing protein [Phycisphaerales bacterium]|nr:PilZ domain-containing protein [Phycisphaerales bacterium]